MFRNKKLFTGWTY